MKLGDPTGSFRPFEHLDKLLRNKTADQLSESGAARPAKQHPPRSRKPVLSGRSGRRNDALEDLDGHELFQRAMADVVPMDGRGTAIVGTGLAEEKQPPSMPPIEPSLERDADTMHRLRRLVDHGEGFIVEHTPEYKEWTGFNVNPWITRRLRQGEFAIQEYIDLHGLAVSDAKHVLDRFLKAATMAGRQSVLIVHGRGLSSPAEPILKARVFEWLTSGVWRKWVVAFSSARLCDGGAGATYVLLRRQALPKRYRKKKQIRS